MKGNDGNPHARNIYYVDRKQILFGAVIMIALASSARARSNLSQTQRCPFLNLTAGALGIAMMVSWNWTL